MREFLDWITVCLLFLFAALKSLAAILNYRQRCKIENLKSSRDGYSAEPEDNVLSGGGDQRDGSGPSPPAHT